MMNTNIIEKLTPYQSFQSADEMLRTVDAYIKTSQLAGYGMYTLSRGERRRRIKSLHIRRFLLQVSFLRCFCLGPLCTNSQIQCKEPLLKGSLRE